jgi:hypothetical protein
MSERDSSRQGESVLPLGGGFMRIYADDERIAKAISAVISRLPIEVQQYARERLLFLYAVQIGAPAWVSVYTLLPALELTPLGRRGALISFVGCNPVNDEGADKLFLHDVAHQIACAWLGTDPDGMGPTAADESNVAQLYTSWGLVDLFGPAGLGG